MGLMTFFRYQYHYFRLSSFREQNKWMISTSMLDRLKRCLEHIPLSDYKKLTSNKLQSIKILSNLKTLDGWEEAMDEAIDIIQSGGEFPMQYQRYGQLEEISVMKYLGVVFHHEIQQKLFMVHSKLSTIVRLLDEQPDHQYTYYLRKIRVLLNEGVDLLTSFNQHYKESQFE